MRNLPIIAILIAILPVVAAAKPPSTTQSKAGTIVEKDFVNASSIPGLKIELRYATVKNFIGANLYEDYNECYLHKIAAEKLRKAVQKLQQYRPGWEMAVWDCLRPRYIQWKFWHRVKGTSNEKWVADPAKGSIHNYGLAIDVSLIDGDGKPIDMGSEFDEFTPASEPRMEKQLLADGKLTEKQVSNRRLLRRIMKDGGFLIQPLEWWHFDALPAWEVRKNFKIVE